MLCQHVFSVPFGKAFFITRLRDGVGGIGIDIKKYASGGRIFMLLQYSGPAVVLGNRFAATNPRMMNSFLHPTQVKLKCSAKQLNNAYHDLDQTNLSPTLN